MTNKHRHLPEIIDKTESEIKHIIELIKSSALPDDVKSLVIKCIELVLWLPLFLQKKSITLHRLSTMIFGKGYQGDKSKGKSKDLDKNDVQNSNINTIVTAENSDTTLEPTNLIADQNNNNIESNSSSISDDEKKTSKPGHGKMANTVYTNCTEIDLLLSLTAGDYCPTKCGGKLGDYKTGVIIRVKGQNFAKVYRYFTHKLRCNLCGFIVKPTLPPEVGKEKYDASFKAILALMKYYMAMPFYRQENFQRMLGMPLSDATQWDLIEQLSGYCYVIFNKLKQYAANSKLIYNDDTSVRILEVIKQIQDGTAGDRTGMYTTCALADYDGHKISLFFNGKQHSGENIGDILTLRTIEEPIIQMSDALSANIPKNMQTILCNCLSHGFRKFSELVDFFDEKCLNIVQQLSKVFEYDAQTRQMNEQDRFIYHQLHSKPIMDELFQYMTRLLSNHEVEPNSDFGKALKYMLKHWSKLTRFLTVVGPH